MSAAQSLTATFKAVTTAAAVPATVATVIGTVALIGVHGVPSQAKLEFGLPADAAARIALEQSWTPSEGGVSKVSYRSVLEDMQIASHRFEVAGGTLTVSIGRGPGAPACQDLDAVELDGPFHATLCEARLLLQNAYGETLGLSRGRACIADGLVTSATLDVVDGRVMMSASRDGVREPACTKALHIAARTR